MKRTWEKVIAWIANVILILLTLTLSVVSFTGIIQELLSEPSVKAEFEAGIREAAAQNPALSGTAISADESIGLLTAALKGFSIFAIVVVVVALIATFMMRKRILSGILFILVALAVTLGSFATLWFVGLAYLIVAILLFVRKEPTNYNNDPFDPNNPNNRVDEIKYV